MADSYTSYRTAMNDAWRGWWVNWPLSRHIRVGDVFGTSDDTLSTAGDLADRGVTFELATAVPQADFTYDAQGTAKVEFKLAGAAGPPVFKALADVDAGALVSFSRSTSALVLYTGLTQQGMRDTRSVATGLVRRYWSDDWADDLIVVHDVITATGATVLASATTDASAELRAAAKVGAGPITLADLSGTAALARSDGLGLQWVGTQATPFFRVFRLHRTWLSNIKVKYPKQDVKGAAPEPIPPLLLEEAADAPDQVLEEVPPGEQPTAARDEEEAAR
ncbi:hypothetical protein [Paractinoplanes maris]|uniref:hypothetical protein n=1 Tax=Paractinoplanes maris TaxID=1734446 RepID=UPI00201FFAF8|nr:hypothetical protein [Actinoplanes maris]